jgi:predicted small lipoprotein YifL
MKKFFAIAIIAASFAACNNSGEKKDTPDTAAVKAPDTTATVPVPDTNSKMAPDTTKMGGDTTKPKM